MSVAITFSDILTRAYIDKQTVNGNIIVKISAKVIYNCILVHSLYDIFVCEY